MQNTLPAQIVIVQPCTGATRFPICYRAEDGLRIIGEVFGNSITDKEPLPIGKALVSAYNREMANRTPQSVPADLKECTDAFEAAGFRRPPTVFTKYDIRGSEYGHWEIGLCDSDNIKIRYRHADPADASLDFEIVCRNVDDFRKWARFTC